MRPLATIFWPLVIIELFLAVLVWLCSGSRRRHSCDCSVRRRRRHDDGPNASAAGPSAAASCRRAVGAEQEPVRRRRRHRRPVAAAPAPQPVVCRVRAGAETPRRGAQSGRISGRASTRAVSTMCRLLLQVHRPLYSRPACRTKPIISSKQRRP